MISIIVDRIVSNMESRPSSWSMSKCNTYASRGSVLDIEEEVRVYSDRLVYNGVDLYISEEYQPKLRDALGRLEELRSSDRIEGAVQGLYSMTYWWDKV